MNDHLHQLSVVNTTFLYKMDTYIIIYIFIASEWTEVCEQVSSIPANVNLDMAVLTCITMDAGVEIN